MPTLTVTAKGQVTLRKEVLRHIGVKAGERIEVDMLPGARVAIRAARQPGKISDVFGALARDDQARLSIEDMNKAIARGWEGRK